MSVPLPIAYWAVGQYESFHVKLHRLDDYQSWVFEVAGRRIAVDPWLTAAHKLPPGHWLFGRRRAAPAPGPEAIANVDALILTGPFADHCDEDTLKVLPRELPVFAQAIAARRAIKMGFTQVTTLHGGDVVTPFDGVKLEAVQPGFPYRHNSIGFVLEADGKRAGFETHVVDLARHGARYQGLDLLVVPVQGVWLLGVPFVMSPQKVLHVVQALKPTVVVPTGNDPQNGHGLLSTAMLFFRGSVEAFGAHLSQAGLPTRFVALTSGQSFVTSQQ